MHIDTLTTHASVWTTIQHMLDKNRLPHALLFTGPRHAGILQFVHRLLPIMVCEQPDIAPCGECKPCHLLMLGTHPDITYVRQDTATSPIKIEQIRELQESIYKTPQCGPRSIIVIEPADRLNRAAANALLKILEEPPSHTTFILIAEQLGTLPATIMSRCQQYVFAPPESFESVHQVDYLSIGAFYPEASERAALFKQGPQMMDDLSALVDRKITPCTLASKWSSHALADLLWFLYLLTAQAIRYRLLDSHMAQSWADKIEPLDLFQQLDKINALIHTVHQNITLNQTLAIETLLLGFDRRSS